MRVALTIDVEQGSRPAAAGNPASILDALAAGGQRATFFVQGRWAGAFPDLVRRMRDEGHLIGNHSYFHAPLDLLTDDGVRTSVRRTETVLAEVAGVDPRPWFRCPYGAGAADERIVRLLAALGYRDVGWDVEPEDWAGRDPGELVAAVVGGCLACGDGARVLLHSWPDATAQALPEIVAGLRAHGAQLVLVDGLRSGLR